MGSKSQGSIVRFAVGRQEGPRSNVWVLFTSKRTNDVYVSSRNFAGVLKVSLHESGNWHYAFTKEHISGPSSLISPNESRMMDRWKRPPEFAPGCVQAFHIFVPSSEVTMPKHSDIKPGWYGKKIHWIPHAAVGFATCFTIVFSNPEVVPSNWEAKEGQHVYTAHPIWHTDLPKDRTKLWLTVHEQPVSDEFREVMETFRQDSIQRWKREMGDAAYAAIVEPRMFLYEPDMDGKRFFLNMSAAS